jgi:hypothetical protein
MTTAHVTSLPEGAARLPPVENAGVVVYEILGVRVGVTADDPAAIALIDRSFDAVRRPLDGPMPPTTVSLRRQVSGAWTVVDPAGVAVPTASGGAGALELLHQLVVALMRGLQERGLLAVHAAAVSRGDRAIVLSGPGGSGKTTLALALAARGCEILSDELAVLDPASHLVYPYRRNVHVRPGTPELVDGMGHLSARPREQLGGGIAWSIPQAELGASVDEAPRHLAGVVMVRSRGDGRVEADLRPMRGSLAAVELMRATWAASRDFAGSLAGLAAVVADVPCMALTPGTPMVTAAAIDDWMRDLDG